MKAAVLNANEGRFDIEEVTIDAPKGREVLVQVKACGLCHSDLHLAEANYGTPLPAVLGHELAGVVTQIGPDVRDIQVGDRAGHDCSPRSWRRSCLRRLAADERRGRPVGFKPTRGSVGAD